MTKVKNTMNSKPKKLGQLQVAKEFLREFGKENLVMASDGNFWIWEGGRWTGVNCHSFQNAIVEFSNGYDQISANWLKSVYQLIRVLASRPEVRFNMDKRDIVNLENGELRFDSARESWTLFPHDLNRFCTIQLPVKYEADAVAPRFLTFLSECFDGDGDKADKIKALLEMIGYSLVNHAKHERFVMLVGNGANGKSVLLKLIQTLCGLQNVSAVQMCSLGRTFQRETLNRSLVNIVTEINEDDVIDYAALKSIVSGEISTVEVKNQTPYVGEPSSTLWLATNHLPKFDDKSDGIVRRALVIPFNNTVPIELRDPDLLDKLKCELPGILNLALDAYASAILNGFTNPESSSEVFRKIIRKADPVKAFVDEMVFTAPDEAVPSRVAFQAYQQWVERNGVTTSISMHAYIRRLNKLGFESYRTSDRRFVKGMMLPFFDTENKVNATEDCD